MTGTKEDLVNYRLERASETLDDARLMAENKRWNSCMNRLYYACFYAVSGLLLEHNLSSSTHKGVRGLFNRHFVKTGQISVENGKLFGELFENRQEGDYKDLIRFDEKSVFVLFPKAELFVEEVTDLAKRDDATND